MALKNTERTSLAAAVRPRLAAHPGQSGLYALADARDALAARLVLADAAQRGLDVQYYIWNKDMVGKVMIERLFRAADRGVRVRLLLDDVGTRPSDSVLLAIDSHPNIEVRMFNPVAMRSLRTLGMVADFARINKRMHNKSLIADGQVAIVGGRNIGDEYFDAHAGANFADLDVAVIGPVVKQASDSLRSLLEPSSRGSDLRTFATKHNAREIRREARGADCASSDRGAIRVCGYGARQRVCPTTPESRDDVSVGTSHDRAVIIPTRCSPPPRIHRRISLRGFARSSIARRGSCSLFLLTSCRERKASPCSRRVRQRGPRVVVITNSLAATDGVPVHSGYQRYRKALLQAGVELYEIKPTASVAAGVQAAVFSGSGGSSSASLHAKTFAFDRRIGFIGSYNLDPRSSRLNTEMGVLFDCPTLTKRLPEETERDLARNAYRVELEGNHLVWVTREGDKEVRYNSEPGAGLLKRIKAQILSYLPIEGLL